MKDKTYKHIAEVYDTLYWGLHKVTIKTLNNYFGSIRTEDKKLLDIGCGTGTFLVEMAKNGWQGTGMDLSPEMIRLADTKAKEQKLPCKFLAMDMREIHFWDRFDLITCNFDTLNYIIFEKDVMKVFNNVHSLLDRNGYFVFDIITPQQGKQFSGKFNTKFDSFEMIMDASYDEKTRLKTIDITLNSEGKTFKEKHTQRCYQVAEINYLLSKSGFAVKQVLDIEGKKSNEPYANAPINWEKTECLLPPEADKELPTRAMFICQKF